MPPELPGRGARGAVLPERVECLACHHRPRDVYLYLPAEHMSGRIFRVDRPFMKIEKVVYGGKGMGRLDGKVCFVEGVIEGEEVEVTITRSRKNYSEAEISSILTPSDDRVSPPCKYYQHCGGCQYQHMTYREELRMKQAQVAEMFSHQLGVEENTVAPIQSHGSDGYRYRSSVTLRTENPDQLMQRLGYVGRDNHSTVIVDDCLLGREEFAKVYTSKFSVPKGVKKISFTIAKDGKVVNSLKENIYHVSLADKDLWAVSSGFFQNNHRVTEQIVRTLGSWVDEIEPHGFYDLYAGVGTFSLLAANHVTQLYLVEENTSCNQCLQLNMSAHRESSWEHYPKKVENCFETISRKAVHGEFMVFLDPPRTGIHFDLSDYLASSVPFRAVAYLSCDLGKLSRDLKRIMKNNSYTIEQVVPFDMFPRTRHIETLVLLRPDV